MEIKDDEFQSLSLKVDQISSELDKQNAVRAVNTKWMVIVGSLILAALGFTNFYQLPREAAYAVKQAIGPKIIDKVDDIVKKLKDADQDADKFLATIEKFGQSAQKNGYALVGDIKFVWGTRTSAENDRKKFLFNPDGKSDELNFKEKCFTVITSLASTSGRDQCQKNHFFLDRIDTYKNPEKFTFVAIGL